jgi:hypothetical protein
VNPKLRAQWEELRQLKQKQSDGARKTNQEYWKRPSVTDSVTDTVISPSACNLYSGKRDRSSSPSADTRKQSKGKNHRKTGL